MRELLTNPTVVYPVAVWWIAQGIKVLIYYARERKVDLRLLTSAGGMPSSHAAFVCAIAVAIAFREGLNSSLFAVAIGLAAVVMSDAMGVRRAAGHHATVLNHIVEELFQGQPISDERLLELLGHTPFQVIAGAILGVLSTWVGMLLIWHGT